MYLSNKHFFLFLGACFAFVSVFAQQDKGKRVRDFFNVKAPAIQYAKPDSSYLNVDLTKGKEVYKPNYYFDPNRLEHSLLEEDSNRIDEQDFSIVEVDEEYNVDSVWVKIAGYYSIWDNRTVNPYRVDPLKYRDTIRLILYDSIQGRYAHLPVHFTRLNDDFGPRKYRWHYGVDLELDTGDSIFASFDGIVRIRKYDGQGYGNYLVVRHYNGLETVYGHLSKQLAEVGQLVKAGDLIGWGGSTGRSSGPHLHYEIRYEGNPIDPEELYDFSENRLISREFYLMPSHFDYMRLVRRVYFHRVKRGDSLLGIADRYNVSLRAILKLNKISMRTTLKPGRRIRIR